MEGSLIPGCTFTTSKVNCHKAGKSESCVFVCVCALASLRTCSPTHIYFHFLVHLRNNNVVFYYTLAI
jgi:hypothetical protein